MEVGDVIAKGSKLMAWRIDEQFIHLLSSQLAKVLGTLAKEIQSEAVEGSETENLSIYSGIAATLENCSEECSILIEAAYFILPSLVDGLNLRGKPPTYLPMPEFSDSSLGGKPDARYVPGTPGMMLMGLERVPAVASPVLTAETGAWTAPPTAAHLSSMGAATTGLSSNMSMGATVLKQFMNRALRLGGFSPNFNLLALSGYYAARLAVVRLTKRCTLEGWRSLPENDSRKKLFHLLQRLEIAGKMCSLANFVAFLAFSEYPDIVHRIAGFRMARVPVLGVRAGAGAGDGKGNGSLRMAASESTRGAGYTRAQVMMQARKLIWKCMMGVVSAAMISNTVDFQSVSMFLYTHTLRLSRLYFQPQQRNVERNSGVNLQSRRGSSRGGGGSGRSLQDRSVNGLWAWLLNILGPRSHQQHQQQQQQLLQQQGMSPDEHKDEGGQQAGRSPAGNNRGYVRGRWSARERSGGREGERGAVGHRGGSDNENGSGNYSSGSSVNTAETHYSRSATICSDSSRDSSSSSENDGDFCSSRRVRTRPVSGSIIGERTGGALDREAYPAPMQSVSLECSKCKISPAEVPHRADCGHIFCYICLHSVLQQQDSDSQEIRQRIHYLQLSGSSDTVRVGKGDAKQHVEREDVSECRSVHHRVSGEGAFKDGAELRDEEDEGDVSFSRNENRPPTWRWATSKDTSAEQNPAEIESGEETESIDSTSAGGYAEGVEHRGARRRGKRWTMCGRGTCPVCFNTVLLGCLLGV